MTGLDRLRTRIDRMHFSRFRFWVQATCFILVVCGGYFGLHWGRSLPILACGYGGAKRLGMCYLMPLQAALSAPWGRWTEAFALATLSGFLIFCLWFLVLNKTWCGFVCPFGTLPDWISTLRRRLGLRAGRYGEDQFRHLGRVKYVLLSFAILCPLGAGGGWLPCISLPFCRICPAKMISPLFTGETGALTIDFSSTESLVMTALGIAVTGLFVAGVFVKKRFWCFFCPMSALQYLLSRPALLRLIKDGDKCTRCGDCHRVCDMDILSIADDVTTRDHGRRLHDVPEMHRRLPGNRCSETYLPRQDRVRRKRPGLRRTHGQGRQTVTPSPETAFNRSRPAREAETVLTHITDDFDDPPTAMKYFYDLFRRVYVQGKDIRTEGLRIGTTCILAPEELIHALSAKPVRLCNGSYHHDQVGADFMPTKSCAVVKATLGMLATENPVPRIGRLDMIVNPTSFDLKKKASAMMAGMGHTVLDLEMPSVKESEVARVYWRRSVRDFAKRLEGLTHRRLSRAPLSIPPDFARRNPRCSWARTPSWWPTPSSSMTSSTGRTRWRS